MTKNSITKALLISFFVLFGIISNAQNRENNSDNQSIGNNKSEIFFIAGPQLFVQTEGTKWELQNSQKYRDVANANMSCEMADDFDVPTGQTWNIKTVIAFGFMSNILDTINVFIYSDNNGAPGSLLHSYQNILRANGGFSYFTGFMDAANTGVYQIELPTVATLTQGKYWLSVQAVKMFETYDDKWSWFNCTSNFDNNFFWKNPLNGSGTGFTDWTDGSIVNEWGTAFGASFILCAPRIANDISILSIDAPVNGTLGTSEIITATIINYGTSSQTGFNIKYRIDNGTWVTENVGSLNIPAGGQAQYSFSTHGNFSSTNEHILDVATALSNDGNTSNDQLSSNVFNYGAIYTFTQFGSATTCNGTFTDPGGINENWNGPFTGTATIYPDGANLRTQLTFLEFDNGWGEFWVYDGVDSNAPAIDLTPDNPNTLFAYDTDILQVVTAKNTSGALTIVFNADEGSYAPGWIASVSCFQPPADDFQFTKLYTDNYIIFDGVSEHLNAVIYNAGLNTQSKIVTFNVNGQYLGVATTRTIGPNESDTVSIEWIPAATGAYNINAQITADGGSNPADNSIDLSTEVYPQGYLVESFEGELFPPEDWSTAKGAWYRNQASGFGINQDGNYYADFLNGEHDTLVTPRLIINNGDLLRFRAYSQMWWFCNLHIYWGETPEGPWNYISTASLQGFETTFQDFEFDISAAVGNHYIAFITEGGEYGWTKSMRLDFVRGPQIFYYNNDLSIKNLECDITPLQNEIVNYNVTVKNKGHLDIADGSYTVKLMLENGETDIVLASLTGTALASMTSIEYNIPYSFTNVSTATIYGLVEYNSDENIVNNSTRSQEIWVQATGTEFITVGNSTEYLNGVAPMSGGENGEVNQTMYYPIEVGVNGTISGITYYFRNNMSYDFENIPVQVWVGETESADLSESFIPASQMNLVFSDNVDIQAQSQGEWFIPFTVPYIYTGKNLVVMVYRQDSPNYAFLEFLAGAGNVPNRTTRVNFLAASVDINDVESLNNSWNRTTTEFLANTTFHRDITGMGEISGLVSDAITSNPISDATIQLMNTTAVTQSDISGNYSFPVVPEGNQTLKAVKFGYNDNIMNSIVVENLQTTTNFIMQPKPQVAVTGKVVRSDNNEGIADLTIPLTGYENYTVTTDANGNFTFPNVYANETYNLTIEYQYFITYVDENVTLVEGQNLDLGTIILQENFEPSFYVNAEEINNDASISWNIPYSGTNAVLNLWDEDGFNHAYTADIDENVWMGNYFDVNQNGSITGFTIELWNYPGYDYSAGDVTMDIFNINEEIVASQQFTIPDSNLEYYSIHIDVPNVTFNQSFYAMIHFNALDVLTPLIAFETGYMSPAPDLAKVKYPNQSIGSFSDLIGTSGIFEITADVILADGKTTTLGNNTKSLTGYNIYRGLINDMENADTWNPLNSTPVNGTTYTDETWTPLETGIYTYAVEALYTEGSSIKSFSNSISYGVYGSLNLNITTNSGISSTGANILLTNNNGDDTYIYSAVADENNTATISQIMSGTYTLSVKLPFYDEYLDEELVIDPALLVLDIELSQIIMTPSQVTAVVNNDLQQVQTTWNIGNSTTYILDDETFEQALNISTDGNAWIGNKFEVSDLGYITSVDIYGTQTETGLGEGNVTVEIFDANGNLLGVSEPATIIADSWLNVLLPNLAFDGIFYAMVHYNMVDANMVGADIDGTNLSSGYYYDAEFGFVALETWDMACALGIRVNANIQGTAKTVFSQIQNNVANEIPENLNFAKNFGSKTANYIAAKSSDLTFNIYLNDLITPIATNLTSYEYLITSEFLTENGTYTVGVASAYTSGISEIITTDFVYGGVGINNLQNNSVVKIYPVPVNNILNISNANNSKGFIYNNIGQLVQTIEINSENSTFDVSNLQSGSYVLIFLRLSINR